MGFFLSLLGYLGGLCATMIVIVASVAYVFPEPQAPRQTATEASTQSRSAPAPSGRVVTRRLAERAVEQR